jgi:hypothetical protein
MTLRRIALALLLLLAAALGALAWRLDRGPIALSFLADRIEAALNGGGPPRYEIGAARIGWEGWDRGGIAPIEVGLSAVRVLDAAGNARVELPEARLAIPIGGLIRGAIAPRWVELRAPVLRVLRGEDGGLDFGLGQAASGPAQVVTPATLARPPDGAPWGQLERLTVLDGRVVVQDRQLGQEWRVAQLFLTIGRQAGGDPVGQAGGDLVLGEERVQLRLAATIAGEPAVARLSLSTPRINPAALARAAPSLAPLGLLDAAAALQAEARIGPAGQPLSATAELEAGPGALDPPGPGRVPIAALRVEAAGEPGRLRLEGLTLRLAPAVPDAPGPVLTASGQARRDDGRLRAEAELALDRAPLDRLEAWWPAGLAPSARDWVTANLAAGVLHDGHWKIAAAAPADLGNVELTALSGRAGLDGVAVRWLPGLPPLEGLSGSASFAPDGITLLVEDGRQARTELRLPSGRLHLTGLGAGPARAELRGRVTGPVSDLWDVLRDPALGLLAGRELPVRDPTGTLDAELVGTLPLGNPLADPTFRVVARLDRLRLPALALGRDLTDGEFDVTLDRDALRAEGSARFAGIPARATLSVDFPNASAELLGLRIEARARTEAARLAAFGFDPGGVLEGPIAAELDYARTGDRPARLAVEADLEGARLSLPPLGYAKPAGAEARAEAVLRLDGTGLSGVERLHAEAPSLLLRARAAEGGGLSAPVEILEGRIGETRFTGEAAPPAAPGGAWRIALRGPVIDLRPLLENAGAASTNDAAGGGSLPALAFGARFDRAITPGTPLHDLSAAATLGGGLREARVAGEVGEPGAAPFAATLAPAAEAGLALRAEAADTGALLAALGLPAPITGGRLDLAATGRPGERIEGRAELAEFALRDVPALGKLLQAFTGYGLFEALSGPGLGFSRLVLPFRLTPEALFVDEARAFSASLGVTAKGRLDRRDNTVDMEGTIVPAYVFNSLLGHLPLVGRLFSAEPGGGLLSVAFEVEGPVTDPRISVNPLSALTPGFLRGLFDLGGEEPGEAAPAPSRP